MYPPHTPSSLRLEEQNGEARYTKTQMEATQRASEDQMNNMQTEKAGRQLYMCVIEICIDTDL